MTTESTRAEPRRPGADEQRRRELLWRLGQVLTAPAPPDWREVRVRYQAAGRHVEVDVLVTGADGVARPERPGQELVRLLGELRAGMYQQGRGTWLVGEFLMRPGSDVPEASFGMDQEPRWRRVPPAVGFRDELATFPRAEEHVPAWLRQRLDGGQVRQARRPSMRTPRVHDGFNKSGRPVVRRIPLPDEERELALAYLEGGAVVMPSRGFDTDAYEPEGPARVPLDYRTDGEWVWPGAVAYYLRERSVTPDPDLVAHMRSRKFVLPQVDMAAREHALAAVNGEDDLLDD
ncbi:ferredoxin [Actinophytocola oryzae]|uniref:Uncharacterized protein n=1 Tax=Actinophytocola oryzae TaxID=502181 RepID=A0A4R7VW87_9PSEU|nr:ferredoxin [Actinophytocola oryzae]TDV54204.1 hypothetical protein CLV71_104675 [Actinophytocola oryzae]